ncbi:MAG: ABC transporter ATP-binding protein [Treponema sp.]|jgi:ABC-2 type transport system ATP-binding protein|nr:ABC transporter ATP-binding protein [Treponema sp.]
MLTVQGVTKVYGSRKVLDNISFTVEDQEILGFLGPNGAGKSTTMNIIAGYTSSTAGTVTVNGREILDDPIGCKKQIGYLPEHPPLYPDMTVDAYLSFMFGLKKVREDKKSHLDEICGAVGIEDVRKRLIKNLSKGYQQRVGLAQAMLGNPRLLILDEPTVGLDPKQILEVRNLIRDMGKRCAVIFSSHILQEIQSVCGRIIIIDNGVLIADDTPENLSRKTLDERLLLTVDGPGEKALKKLRQVPGMKSAELSGSGGTAEFILESEEGRDVRRDLFRMLAENGWPILSLRQSGVSLENVFLRLTAGDSSAVSVLAGTAEAEGEEARSEEAGASGEAEAPDGKPADGEGGDA